MSNNDILLQLRRILTSSPIVNANVLSEFLSFVVTETIEGRGQELKEYTIGIYALHRDAYFNPQTDSTVRIHAGRLRRSLKEYYYEEGKHDPIVISIPKGCYTPAFTMNGHDRNVLITESGDTSDPIDEKAGLSNKLVNGYDSETSVDPTFSGYIVSKKTVVAIIPFNYFNHHSLKSFTKGLCEYLRTELTHFETLDVVHYTDNPSSKMVDGKNPEAVRHADYILTGSVQEPGRIRVCVQLNCTETGEQVWAYTFDKKNSTQTLWEFQEEVVNLILATVTGVNGMILNHGRQVFQTQHSQKMIRYPLTFWYHKYSNYVTPEVTAQAKRFYENALHQHPSHPLLLSFLSEIYSGESYIMPDSLSKLDQALSLARRALQIDPRCQQAHLALAINFLVRGNSKKCIYLLDQGAGINTKSVDYKGAMGALLIYAGEFERGMCLVTDALSRNPYLPGWHSFSQCLYYYYKERYADVIILLDRLSASALNATVIKASAYAELGEFKMAKSMLSLLESEHPSLDFLNPTVLKNLFASNPLVARIQKSLVKIFNTTERSTNPLPLPFTVNNRI